MNAYGISGRQVAVGMYRVTLATHTHPVIDNSWSGAYLGGDSGGLNAAT